MKILGYKTKTVSELICADEKILIQKINQVVSTNTNANSIYISVMVSIE